MAKKEEEIISKELRYFISKMDKKTRAMWIKGLSPASRKKFLKAWFRA